MKYTVVSRKNDYKFEQVQEITCFGSQQNTNNNVLSEIKQRKVSGNRSYFVFTKLIKSTLLNIQLKMKMYKTLIRPIVT